MPWGKPREGSIPSPGNSNWPRGQFKWQIIVSVLNEANMPLWRFIARGLLPILSLGLFLTFAHGCSKRTPQQQKPVGGSDPRIREVVPILTEWVGLWNAAMPGFRAESLYFAGQAAALRGYVQPARNVLPPGEDQQATFEVLSADSPDQRHKLVFDWYQHLGDSEGELDIGEEPDSAPLLIDLRQGVSNQFASCGTPCGFHWGAWISPTKFVLSGWTELDPERRRFRGSLSWVALRYRALNRQARLEADE